MGRWQPNARGRLLEAAMELFAERGYEQTTVGEIAKRAGLTERTFFRHYADKREVLFGGAQEMRELFTRTLAGLPASAGPMEAVGATLAAVAEGFRDRHAFARHRQALIAANAELRERELIKLADLSATVAGALRERGVGEPAASLAAEAAIAVFRVAFERWTRSPGTRELGLYMEESLVELKAVTAGA
ncbi:helix-turn-helix domain-containing protein [Streptomyces sp. NPDC001941]|uniref:TetR/AcrR family transcriptional regulator n=1 Tax=Streptomyces sp. NPDC001941 TaxID=3154659 RepID=UPI0033349FD2